jgi:hypothetical protein
MIIFSVLVLCYLATLTCLGRDKMTPSSAAAATTREVSKTAAGVRFTKFERLST